MTVEDFAEALSVPTPFIPEKDPEPSAEPPNPEEYDLEHLAEQEQEDVPQMSATELVEGIFRVLNLIIEYLGSFLLKNKIFENVHEYRIAKAIARKKTRNEEEAILKEKIEVYEDLRKNIIPISEEEEEELKKPLIQWLGITSKKLPPWLVFLILFATMISAKIIYVRETLKTLEKNNAT